MFPSSNVIIPVLDYERCQACRKCEAAANCRFKAFVRIDRDEPPYIDVARCGGCWDCVPHCPFDALSKPEASNRNAVPKRADATSDAERSDV